MAAQVPLPGHLSLEGVKFSLQKALQASQVRETQDNYRVSPPDAAQMRVGKLKHLGIMQNCSPTPRINDDAMRITGICSRREGEIGRERDHAPMVSTASQNRLPGTSLKVFQGPCLLVPTSDMLNQSVCSALILSKSPLIEVGCRSLETNANFTITRLNCAAGTGLPYCRFSTAYSVSSEDMRSCSASFSRIRGVSGAALLLTGAESAAW